MYRIRFHGRGGQGMKTASRILGTAFFLEGFEVQDAPIYGAERRGAPLFAYVRADKTPINERGVIRRPDLVVVSDDSLLPIPTAGVTRGVTTDTILLINSEVEPATWKDRLNYPGPIITLKNAELTGARYIGAACAAGAAALTGVISKDSLSSAIREEIGPLGEEAVKKNLECALDTYALMEKEELFVKEGSTIEATGYIKPEWIELKFEEARVSTPAIHAAATSEKMKTGLWRITTRPEIDYDRCNKCWWLCSTFCPDSAIKVDDEGFPRIDYEHCKGCMICVTQCPTHAISATREHKEEES